MKRGASSPLFVAGRQAGEVPVPRSIPATAGPGPVNQVGGAVRLCLTLMLLAAVILLGNAPALAATRYVDKANSQCSDSGPGSQQNPYCTINKAASVAVAGDTVVVAAGVYSERVTLANSGTSSAPITFTVADGANVTVEGKAYGFYASSRSWITINGFRVANTDDDGIYLKYCSNITVSNNHVSYAGLPISGYIAHGIYLNSTVDSRLLNNTVEYNSDAGIALTNGSTGNTLKGNICTHNARGYIRAAPGIDIRSGTNTVDSNICHDNEDTGIQLYTTSPRNTVVVNNLCYDNGDHGIDISRPSGNVVIGNTVYNNVTAGINLEGSATGSTLANNISVDNGINSPRTSGNIRVDSDSTSGTTLDYDLVYLTRPSTMIVWGGSSYSSLSAFTAATGKETHGLQADPMWASAAAGDFHLLAGSPAIDSANSGASNARNVDLEGRARVDDPATVNTGTGPRAYDDRGAFEFQPSTDPVPPTVSLTAPSNGATVSGTIQVSATASDNVGVVGVRFKLDGANLGTEDTTAPYSISWNTTTAGNGTHSLTAVARDAAGNITTSNAVNIIVDNPDTTPPTVFIMTPAEGAVISGTISVSANAQDNVGVVGIQFKLDGTNLGSEGVTSPYTISWDTTTVGNGAHSLTAVARDAAGNTAASTTVGVTVANADTTPPTVAITAPTEGATVSGTIAVNATASDNVGVVGVQFKLNGNDLGAEDTSAPYSLSWDTSSVANGTHSLTAVARDATGNTAASSAVGVTVANADTTPPTVAITSPAEGVTVSGTIAVNATASDNVGVVGVQFKLDGNDLGAEVTSAPYSLSWDTTSVANGTHSLTAVARDAAGNTATSTAVGVTVNNQATLTLTPTADAYLNASSPAKNYGSSARLWAQYNPTYSFLMKFSVSGIGTRLVTSAKVRLHNVNSSNRGGDFHRVGDNSWTELGVTWNNAPAGAPTPLASLGAVASNTWVEVDVASLITGDGVFSLRVDSTSSDSVGYDSKEATDFAPQLIVTLQ